MPSAAGRGCGAVRCGGDVTERRGNTPSLRPVSLPSCLPARRWRARHRHQNRLRALRLPFNRTYGNLRRCAGQMGDGIVAANGGWRECACGPPARAADDRSPPPPTSALRAANLAAFLTVSQLQASVHSLSDLRGKAVGTASIYTARLARHGLAAATYDADAILVSSVRLWLEPGRCTERPPEAARHCSSAGVVWLGFDRQFAALFVRSASRASRGHGSRICSRGLLRASSLTSQSSAGSTDSQTAPRCARRRAPCAWAALGWAAEWGRARG